MLALKQLSEHNIHRNLEGYHSREHFTFFMKDLDNKVSSYLIYFY